MSFRDLRNFTEMMRALGYPRLISMENFRTPNFTLVAEILTWLVQRFDPDADVHTSVETEEDRVLLIRSVAEFMALKANVMLNTKKLYQADGHAVKELLKPTSLLYNAIQANRAEDLNDNPRFVPQEMADITSRIQDLKVSRELASQVTSKGASLYQLLEREVELREIRNTSVSQQLELSVIENGLKEAIAATKDSISSTKSLIENVSATESSLDAKIEKKEAELERNQKRLQTLKKVRPAFLEEFEKLEIELQELYQEYITRTRCIAYLEQQQEEATVAEQERMQRKQKETRKLMEELQLEDARKLLEDEGDIDDTFTGDTPQAPKENSQPTRRIRTATASKARLTTGRKRVYGGMNANDDDSISIDSDSDLLLDDDDDDDNSDLLGSGDDIDALPLSSVRSDQSDDNF